MKKVSLKFRRRASQLYFASYNKILSTGIKDKRKAKIVVRLNKRIDRRIADGLDIVVKKRNKVHINLPQEMDFSNNYEITAAYINTIRDLVEKRKRPHGCYRLEYVCFDGLRRISTSAALVLTSELSNWESRIKRHLKPRVEGWDPFILRKFQQLGFFQIFWNGRYVPLGNRAPDSDSNLVEYIKGVKGEKKKARQLGSSLRAILDRKDIQKWTFLHSGLTEAIINVGHHAYPSNRISEDDKVWFMGGSYNKVTKELKVTFYDQGIGIPKSLPSSRLWERALDYLSFVPVVERKLDKVMLAAAMEMDRTSTDSNDRGKGLQDLLQFVKQRQNGYLTVFSAKGLYKYSMNDGVPTIKKESFEEPIRGTLIIWKVNLID